MSSYKVSTRGWEGYITIHKFIIIAMIASTLLHPTGLRFLIILFMLIMSTVSSSAADYLSYL
jgi:uncharacterized membrane protein